jgi:Fatty acid desaturase
MLYMQFMWIYVLLIINLIGICLGGMYMWSGLIALVILVTIGDFYCKESIANPHYKHIRFLNALLYGTLPIICLTMLCLIFQASINLKYAYKMHVLFATIFYTIGAIISTAFMIGIGATNIAHELMHRGKKFATFYSKCLLVFSFDVPLILSHNYGHHIFTCEAQDHATAKRGESSYHFILRSSIDGHKHAWKLEKKRLHAQQYTTFSLHNRILRSYACSLICILLTYMLSSFIGMLVFTVTCIMAKCILELINYIQHYGLVKMDNSKIDIHHAWNSNKYMSTVLLFNLTRHSHHHLHPHLPFWQLKSLTKAPVIPLGYLTAIIIALLPYVWKKLMSPYLLKWDETYADYEMQI